VLLRQQQALPMPDLPHAAAVTAAHLTAAPMLALLARVMYQCILPTKQELQQQQQVFPALQSRL
jgi:hypothetical protein